MKIITLVKRYQLTCTAPSPFLPSASCAFTTLLHNTEPQTDSHSEVPCKAERSKEVASDRAVTAATAFAMAGLQVAWGGCGTRGGAAACCTSGWCGAGSRGTGTASPRRGCSGAASGCTSGSARGRSCCTDGTLQLPRRTLRNRPVLCGPVATPAARTVLLLLLLPPPAKFKDLQLPLHSVRIATLPSRAPTCSCQSLTQLSLPATRHARLSFAYL